MTPSTAAAAGTLVEVDGHPTLRFERRLPAPIGRVWLAVTDAGELRAWFPAAVEGERRVGARLRFPFEGEEAPAFEGEVVEWDPPRAFAFTWNGDLLRFELRPDGDGTALVFTQSLPGRAEAARTGAGWHTCLDALAAHLRGGDVPEGDGIGLLAEYLARMGPPVARRDGAELTFERTHHLAPDDMAEVIDRWGRAGDASVAIERTDHGCRYQVRVPAGEPAEAARWHADLIELDVFAASGRSVTVDAEQFVPEYRSLLA